jgi:acyl-CoA synthetase (NDP forming)
MTEVGVRVIGPNCQGIADFYNGVNTSFSLPPVTSKGGLSIVSQSGAFATSCLRWASELGLLGLNKFVTLGNMADVDVTEVLAFLGQDEKTKSIAMYLEGTTRARALIETASEVTRKKPITVIKAGKSDVGSRVALSHTASVAGDDIIYDGAFRQAGVIRADSVAEFYHTSRVFDKLPVPKGDRVCLLTVVGGPSTICVDTLIATGQARLANFSQEFKEKARKILIASANVGNPDGYIDMTASVTPIMHEQIINLIMEEEGIDALLFLTTPPKFLKDREQAESILAGYNSVPEDKRKPMLTVLMAGTDVGECWKLLEAGGLPAMDMPDVAAKVMANMVGYGRYLRRAEFR